MRILSKTAGTYATINRSSAWMARIRLPLMRFRRGISRSARRSPSTSAAPAAGELKLAFRPRAAVNHGDQQALRKLGEVETPVEPVGESGQITKRILGNA